MVIPHDLALYLEVGMQHVLVQTLLSKVRFWNKILNLTVLFFLTGPFCSLFWLLYN